MAKDRVLHIEYPEVASTYSQHPDAQVRAQRSLELLRRASASAHQKGQAELAERASAEELSYESEQLEVIVGASIQLLVAVWKSIQAGKIDERSPIADAALVLRDALNPEWPANTDWLPDEIQD